MPVCFSRMEAEVNMRLLQSLYSKKFFITLKENFNFHIDPRIELRQQSAPPNGDRSYQLVWEPSRDQFVIEGVCSYPGRMSLLEEVIFWIEFEFDQGC
jgi:hypothetical protein